ncbi:MAG: PorT family protein [Muribaculaceae bacterium]|nr:PorT family protein [Muribaculaceae bacterium]
MKKILTIVMILAVALGASAKFRLGPTVGTNWSMYHFNQHLVPTDMRAGFQGGLLCEVMIPGIGFGVDFGVKYTNWGGHTDFGKFKVWEGMGNPDLRMHTISIPVNLRFKYTRLNGFEQYLAPLIYAGPQLNFNAANKHCAAIDRNGVSLGIQLGLGAEIYRRYQITAGYIWNVTHDFETRKLDDVSARIEGWNLSVAVLF